jgi:3-oxoacyl-[acyl-carrier-protein] synthase II
MGWVTPLGDDIEKVWQRLLNGDSGMAPTTLFDASTFPSTFSAEVKDFDLNRYLGADAEQHTCGSRNTQFALAAAKMAWEHSGLGTCPDLDRTSIGIYLGGGEGPIDFNNFAAAAVGGWDYENNDLDAVKWVKVAGEKLNPVTEIEQDPNMAAGHLACFFDARGPSFNTLTACAASTQAIGEATYQIRRGDAEVVISGGTHSMLHPFGVTGFNRLTALSTRNDEYQTASRPFDRTRDGFVLGEGSSIVILEELEHAKKRGARIFGEIIGYGSTADAFRVTDMHEEGRGGLAAIQRSLEDAGLRPEDIDYISAHGTGTQENDKIESLAIQRAFGDYATKVPVSSIKSMMGHLIAAAGATELIACVLAIRDGIMPPTTNYEHPDPNCPLDYVPNKPRKADLKNIMSNSFGFGGQNDTLVVSKYEG